MRRLLLLLSLVGVACGSSTDNSATHTFDYPRDDVLRLDQIQLKATHNSYHVAPPDMTSGPWAYTHAPLDQQLQDQGVRGLELDIHLSKDTNRFEVYHIAYLDTGTRCQRFTECLSIIKHWSDAHLAHHALFIHLEPKDLPPVDDPGSYFAELEHEVTSVWPRRRIVTPDDVRGDAPTLRDAVKDHGFPTLGETRSKILFYVDNTGAWRDAYTQGSKDVHGRLMFVNSSLDDPFGAIRILNDPVSDQQAIVDAVGQHFIVRTRADGEVTPPPPGDTMQFDAAVQSGAQIVTTDFPSADEGGGGYIFNLPGGTPSRCNPRTAPADCTSTDVEDPSQM